MQDRTSTTQGSAATSSEPSTRAVPTGRQQRRAALLTHHGGSGPPRRVSLQAPLHDAMVLHRAVRGQVGEGGVIAHAAGGEVALTRGCAHVQLPLQQAGVRAWARGQAASGNAAAAGAPEARCPQSISSRGPPSGPQAPAPSSPRPSPGQVPAQLTSTTP